MQPKLPTRLTGTIHTVLLGPSPVGGIDQVPLQVAEPFLTEGPAEPVAADDAAARVRPQPSELGPVSPLVLVVDDDPEARQLMGSILTAHGYRVVVAGHGKDAMRQLREQGPDLILLDLNMPVMDGWTFRTEQRYFADKRSAAVPVLLMTGIENAQAHVDPLRAHGVIKKPFDPDDVRDAVSAALESRRLGS